MTSFLGITAAGHIGSVDEFKYTQSGTPLCKFTMAVNLKADSVLWLRCTAFGKLAESIQPYLKPGKHILVESNELKSHAFLAGGTPKASTDIVIKSLKFMGKRQDEPEPQYAGFDDSGDQLGDIPF